MLSSHAAGVVGIPAEELEAAAVAQLARGPQGVAVIALLVFVEDAVSAREGDGCRTQEVDRQAHRCGQHHRGVGRGDLAVAIGVADLDRARLQTYRGLQHEQRVGGGHAPVVVDVAALGDGRTVGAAILAERPLPVAVVAIFAEVGLAVAAKRGRVYLQTGGPDTVAMLYPRDGVESLAYTLPEFDVRIEFEPVSFVQINSEVNRQMVGRAVALLDLEPGHRVLDLYCGIGNFSLPLARRSASVLGIEGDAALVDAARRNAERNALTNAAFQCADLSAIDGSEGWLQAGWDRVLLDPARSGAAEVIKHMPKIAAQRIVYVSCHPGTLARDAGVLVSEHGYQLEAAGIIDMFPHTAHVESIAVFSKLI